MRKENELQTKLLSKQKTKVKPKVNTRWARWWTAVAVDSPISTGVLDHDVMVLVDAADGAGGGERLEHAVGPASVPVLQGLHNLQVQVDVNQVANLQPSRIPTAILFTWS